MNTSPKLAHRIATGTAATITLLALSATACSSTPATTASSTTTAPPVSTTGTSPGSTAGSTQGSTGSAATSGGPGAITVKLFQFKPSPLTVPAGTKVTWTSDDDTVHEPSSGTPDAPTTVFDVELDGKGSSASFTFATPGTYAYYCKVHTSMTGQVIVT